MWSAREREELAVWADRLQAEGQPLGELVATSLMAADLLVRDPTVATSLQARVHELERAVRDPMVADLLARTPGLELQWEHGVVVSLRVTDSVLGQRLDRPLDDRATRSALDVLRRVLGLPVARFLRHLSVNLVRGPGWRPLHLEVPALLAEPEILARPWSLVLGLPPQRLRQRAPVALLGRDHPQLAEALAPSRGLRSVFVSGVRVNLPWQRGDKGARLRAASTLADGHHDEPTTMTRLARALWDPSLRVRLRILDTLPLLGADVAPLVPDLLLIQRGELEWLTRVREVLAILARDPETVRAVALNFTVDQPRCASWLAASPLAVSQLAEPRIADMLMHQRIVGAWIHQTLSQAHERLHRRAHARDIDRRLDPRTPGSKPLLARLRRWLAS